jgi:hypothetical protein
MSIKRTALDRRPFADQGEHERPQLAAASDRRALDLRFPYCEEL